MIENYQFGKIVIDGVTYTKDVIVTKEKVIANWWRKSGHELCVADIEHVIDQYSPEKLIVGTGKFGMVKVLPETKEFLAKRNVQLQAYHTRKACEVFNAEFNEKNVVGAFHLTC